MANSDHKGDGAPPSKIHVGPATKKAGWLPWLLLGLGLIALLFGLRRCSNDETTTRVETAPVAAPVADTAMAPAPAPPAPAGTTAILAGTSGVGTYLAGTDALPRTFVFEKLYFDTAKSDIRAADREEVRMLSAAMKQYPNSRIQIVGYADARGDASANATLGKERAESVKAALVADGTAADRIDTASGGETNPADTNATSSGQAENRRTELIVLQR
jgi:outer membrane protein OmpA-like peptidoglycan-associated protein